MNQDCVAQYFTLFTNLALTIAVNLVLYLIMRLFYRL